VGFTWVIRITVMVMRGGEAKQYEQYVLSKAELILVCWNFSGLKLYWACRFCSAVL